MKYASKLACWAGISIMSAGLLASCGGSDSSAPTLSVQLSTQPKPADDVYQAVQLLNGIKKFQVELLAQDGKPLDLVHVEVPASSNYAQVKFDVPAAGNYQIRSSAYMANQALLGTTLKPVQVNASGDTKLVIDNLGLSALYYASNTHLPQTQSQEALEQFLSTDQPGISLQGYCFFGYLGDIDNKPLAYFSLIQRFDQRIKDLQKEGVESRLPVIMAGAGVGSSDIKGFRLTGAALLAELKNKPWDATVTLPAEAGSEPNKVRARLVSGTFGQKGAFYELTSSGVDSDKKPMTTKILVEDTMGFVSEGFGPNAFLPNWLTPQQQTVLNEQFGGSVERYLATTQEPLTGQGSYYYSAPYLTVKEYEVTYDHDGSVSAKGTGGLLWMDVVYQTFEDDALNIVGKSSWSFFIMQLKNQSGKEQAIMTTRVEIKDEDKAKPNWSDYKVSSLFEGDAKKNPNGVLEPVYRWNVQDIKIDPVKDSVWKSPVSGLDYYTKYKVTLLGERPADLTVTMAWDEQEVNVPNTEQGGYRSVYEGLGKVTGTLNGETVTGTAWLEMQPVGKL